MKRTRRTAILPIALLVWTGVAGAKVHVRAHAAKGSRPLATTSAAVAADCNCCCFSQLAFTTGLPDIGATGCSDASGTISGTVVDDGGAALCNLKLGGLYFGGAGVGVPLPLVIPDQGSSITKITSCDAVTGDFILAATTDCNSLYCRLDPREGARIAVAEAARICRAAEPGVPEPCRRDRRAGQGLQVLNGHLNA